MIRLLLVAIAVLLPAVAAAQPAHDPTTASLVEHNADGSPARWAKDVSSDDRAAARTLFAEGNRRLHDGQFPRAADSYREALKRWDHPAIHYHLALALLHLDAPIEVHGALTKAIAYGPDPLARGQFERAQDYLKQVVQTLGLLEVTLFDHPDGESDTMLTIDNKAVSLSHGGWSGRVRAGEHTVTASRDGYPSLIRKLTVGPGEAVRVDLRMYTGAGRCHTTPPRWPYLMIGAGAGTLAATTAFRRSLDTGQSVPGYAFGVLAIVIGAVPLIRRQLLPADCNPVLDATTDPPVAIAPMLGRDLAGVAAAIRF